MPRKKAEPKKIELNEEQREVVSARHGRYAVLAGPGAGKTSVLVERLVRLVEEGVTPSDLLSLSFTSTAAKNLRDRVEARVGKLSTNRTAGCLTFHSMALSFAQEEHDASPSNWPIFLWRLSLLLTSYPPKRPGSTKLIPDIYGPRSAFLRGEGFLLLGRFETRRIR